MIKVTATGMATAQPDTVEIQFTLEARHLDYKQAVEAGAAQLDSLRACLALEGFVPADLVTTSFKVDTEYESVQTPTGYSNVFKGYVVRHQLKLFFPLEISRLGHVLEGVGQCVAAPEVRLNYTLKDEQRLKEEALQDAYHRGVGKATALAEAAGVQLGTIIEMINNSSIEHFPTMRLMLQPASGFELQPDVISTTEEISISWSIFETRKPGV